MIDDLSWLEFLQRWSAERIALANSDDDLPLPEGALSQVGWLGRPPASEEQIAAAETRLGRALPPSLRAFYAVTNGWPLTSFDFGEIVPVEDLAWFPDVSPEAFEIWSQFDDEDDVDAVGAVLARSILVSTGSDRMLIDMGRHTPGDERPSYGLTSWYPGIGDEQQTFRDGLQSHYASFVRFDAADSITHVVVSERVEAAYVRLLAGDLSAESDLEEARNYGNPRADVLSTQMMALKQNIGSIGYAVQQCAADAGGDEAFTVDLWPMLVSAVYPPPPQQQHPPPRRPLSTTGIDFEIRGVHEGFVVRASADTRPGPVSARPVDTRPLDGALAQAPPDARAVLADTVTRHQRDGALRADYDGPFGEALHDVRALVQQQRHVEAWNAFLAALPLWRPASPTHLAPMAIVWDADLCQLWTAERGKQLLVTPRGA